MQIIARWFHIAKILKPFPILLCGSWVRPVGCLSTHLLLGHFQPPSHGHWTHTSSFSSLWVLCQLLFFLPLSPPARDTSWASPSTVAYSHILTLRLCPNLLQSACAVHPPLPTLLNTPLGPCWLWCLLRLSTWLSTGHLPAQHVNFVTSAWSPAPSPPYHLKQELLALTIDATHSELR